MASSTAAGRFAIPLLMMALIQLGSLPEPVSGRPCKSLFISIIGPFPDPNLPATDPSSPYSGFVTIFAAALPAVELEPETAVEHETRTGSSETPRPDGHEEKEHVMFGILDLSTLDGIVDAVGLVLVCFSFTVVIVHAFNSEEGSCLEESDDGYYSDEEPKKRSEKNGYVKIPAPNPFPVPSESEA